MVKDTIRLDDLPPNSITQTLINTLSAKKCNVVLESIAETELRYVVKKGRLKTTAVITRYRHKPLYVEIDVDNQIIRDLEDGHKRLMKKEAAMQRKNSNPWRFMFLILFYAVFFIASIIVAGTETFRTWLEEPGNQFIFLGTVVLGAVGIYLISPILRKKRIRSLEKFDTFVFGQIHESLINLQKEQKGEIKTLRCWNCFEEADSSLKYCENCGKEITI